MQNMQNKKYYQDWLDSGLARTSQVRGKLGDEEGGEEEEGEEGELPSQPAWFGLAWLGFDNCNHRKGELCSGSNIL